MERAANRIAAAPREVLPACLRPHEPLRCASKAAARLKGRNTPQAHARLAQ